MTRDIEEMSCIDCGVAGCGKPDGSHPAFCPTAAMGEEGRDEATRAYEDDPFALAVIRAASSVSAEGFDRHWCRRGDRRGRLQRGGLEDHPVRHDDRVHPEGGREELPRHDRRGRARMLPARRLAGRAERLEDGMRGAAAAESVRVAHP